MATSGHDKSKGDGIPDKVDDELLQKVVEHVNHEQLVLLVKDKNKIFKVRMHYGGGS